METKPKRKYTKGDDTPEEIQMCLHCTKKECTNCLARNPLESREP